MQPHLYFPAGPFFYQTNWSIIWAREQMQAFGLSPEVPHETAIIALRDWWENYQHFPLLRLYMQQLKTEHPNFPWSALYLEKCFGHKPFTAICYFAGLPRPKHCI